MTPTAHPAEPRIVEYTAGVLHRVPWPEGQFTIDGATIQLTTIITEVLRAADSIGLLIDSPDPPEPSAVSVEAAVRLLASYHPRYSDDPYRVLESLPHAYHAARTSATGQREIDTVDAARALLLRHGKTPR